MARDCVYIIGAGFSAGLGYPLTHDLLFRLWPRLQDDAFKEQFTKIIEFHHRGFDSARFSSFPNVEKLLSQMAVNDEFFDASRNYGGKFTREKLRATQQEFLLKIAHWFHSLSVEPSLMRARVGWLSKFRDQAIRERAAIISFNWDLVLDDLLFGKALNEASYGLSEALVDSPVLLKPHGSLNWFEDDSGKFIKENMKFAVHSEAERAVYAFRDLSRAPETSHDRTYLPLIIPPVYLKKFDEAIFKILWQKCTAEISTAKKVVFLGYSMPMADLHTQFIIRCGFHNQIKGQPAENGGRTPPVGAAEVTIVNPDRDAAERIASVVGSQSPCHWISKPAADWVMDDMTTP